MSLVFRHLFSFVSRSEAVHLLLFTAGLVEKRRYVHSFSVVSFPAVCDSLPDLARLLGLCWISGSVAGFRPGTTEHYLKERFPRSEVMCCQFAPRGR